MNDLTKLIEAALFSSAHAVSVGELKKLSSEAAKEDVQASLEELKRALDEQGHGIELVEVAEGFQLLTRPELADAIADARIVSRPRKLSVAALETLAIIAYRQPVGRAEIEEIRGVAADGVLKSLHERNLIDIVGRSEGLGRPLLYGTTGRFLEMMGLKDLSELPDLDNLSVALRPLAVSVAEDEGDGEEELAGGVVVKPRTGSEEAEITPAAESPADQAPDSVEEVSEGSNVEESEIGTESDPEERGSETE
ncbi:MAG: SMC-Scp complex subunit ScpB [Gemmatimonadota bacterium]|nr:SMC-Scp complex subunit ScpB [Gemmatimonadota bacterium]MDH5803805.1 SMC-Scp complex subunit ScpB [Gemmatimonadota bacterium]